jgi:molybdenum cofactor cytidylyltransferase
MSVTAILLAAGSARRFGSEKLPALYRGRPLYEHALEALVSSLGVSETLVIVRPDFPLLPERPRVRLVVNPNHAEGMASSLRVGARAASADSAAYLIALADMPAVNASLVAELIEFHRAGGARIAVPRYEGRRGHPVLIDAKLRDELLALSGDVGAREIIAAHPEWTAYMDTDDAGVVFDVDEPADIASGSQGE